MKKKELTKRLCATGLAVALAFSSTGLIALADEKDEEQVLELEDEEEKKEEEKEEQEEQEEKEEQEPELEAEEEENGESEASVNFKEKDTELYVGSDWAGANADAVTSKDKVDFHVKNFGWANSEWAIQYIIKDLGFHNNTTYTLEFDITSTVDKDFFLKLDDGNGFIAEKVSLDAGKKMHYMKSVSCGEFSEKPYLFFALGQMSGEEVSRSGEITLENLVITEGEKEPVDIGDDEKKKGKEHDFTKDNSEFDAKDSGKTKAGYELIWADEFDGNYGDASVDKATGLNLDNWAYQLGDGSTDCGNYGWGNNELQCYTNRPENVGVNEDLNDDGEGEGVLRITAKRENGYTYKTESAKNYTSARLRTTKPTEALFNTTYGYVEARIALPATAGAWPAFWMLPQSTTVYGNWPVSGEIDIMETCGAFTDKDNDVACGTLHWGTPTHVYKGSGYVNLDSDYTYFHTYAIDWQPGEITWYYDGKPINTLNNWESAIPGASDSLAFDAPFDMPFYMLLNLAVDSGQFGGSVNKARFDEDINMYVDYVRVFQKEDGYPDTVTRKASDNAAENWKDYAGINQIADLTEENLETCEGGGMSDSSADKDKWYLSYQQDATDAKLDKLTKDDTAWAKVAIASPGSQDYSVQLIGHYDAKAGYVYKVSFDAYADGGMVGKTVNCDSKEWKGWSTYGVTQAKLTKEKTHYSYTFAQTEDFDNCRIEFNFGAQASGNVYIANPKVEIVDPAALGTSEKARTPLSDGNMIYNGTFDQGDNRTGYWAALSNTKLNVRRYTTEALGSDDMMVVDVASKTNYEGITDGKKYYERRAEISSTGKNGATIYQPDMKLSADKYTVEFDMYSQADSAVKVGAYTLTEKGNELKLGRQLGSATAFYKKADGVRHYTLAFETREAVENAVVAFTFAKGTKVQLDNVYMNGANQKSNADEHPLKTDSSYRGDNGGGVEIPLENQDGAVTMSGITSGGSWYSPQLASGDFELVAGQKYVLSFDYNLSGNHNNTFQYIIQENGGSWHVFADGPETVSFDNSKSEDGFNHYEKEFVADASISSVHLNFGFGNSGANGDAAFAFKNAKIDLVKQTAVVGEVDNETVSDSVFYEKTNESPAKPVNSGSASTIGNTSASNNTTVIEETKTPTAGNVDNSVDVSKTVNASASKKTKKTVVKSEEQSEGSEVYADESKEAEEVVDDSDEVVTIQSNEEETTIQQEETPKGAEQTIEGNNGFNVFAVVGIMAAFAVFTACSFVVRNHLKKRQ
ncbi:Glycosyl hydrolases family 16 [Pseudobutyrivibrio sp. OR37]|uniref:glycoside hydrolase family 16 protein n=1 Tax=Pseudobutyrivibrio sp. OR37 TaxID=1798186 RepID=UPI0008EBF93C|nr:glycoside hydrolase family 16 protein [Pseudobutyrivibrio sp. OR37]SFH69394.1 Glycosyl hydrolases family 16 [Pseudobutyrivibrio sp. OR37]